jgi:hypothetical protein
MVSIEPNATSFSLNSIDFDGLRSPIQHSLSLDAPAGNVGPAALLDDSSDTSFASGSMMNAATNSASVDTRNQGPDRRLRKSVSYTPQQQVNECCRQKQRRKKTTPKKRVNANFVCVVCL